MLQLLNTCCYNLIKPVRYFDLHDNTEVLMSSKYGCLIILSCVTLEGVMAGNTSLTFLTNQPIRT